MFLELIRSRLLEQIHQNFFTPASASLSVHGRRRMLCARKKRMPTHKERSKPARSLVTTASCFMTVDCYLSIGGDLEVLTDGEHGQTCEDARIFVVETHGSIWGCLAKALASYATWGAISVVGLSTPLGMIADTSKASIRWQLRLFSFCLGLPPTR